MPNSETPALIPSDSHMSGSMPVLMASIGVYCRTAGGFFFRLCAPFLLVAHCTGSISAGHQFFGGALKSIPQTVKTTRMYTPTRSGTPDKGFRCEARPRIKVDGPAPYSHPPLT